MHAPTRRHCVCFAHRPLNHRPLNRRPLNHRPLTAATAHSPPPPQTQRRLMAALVLAFAFMVVEVVGGVYAHSLAIITDAAHLLSDVSGFAVAAFAAFWAARRSREYFSYG